MGLLRLAEPFIQNLQALLYLLVLWIVHQVIAANVVGDPTVEVLLDIQLGSVGIV